VSLFDPAPEAGEFIGLSSFENSSSSGNLTVGILKIHIFFNHMTTTAPAPATGRTPTQTTKAATTPPDTPYITDGIKKQTIKVKKYR
jgi:hypothetical protein